MESLTALLILIALLTRFLGKGRVSAAFFALALVMVALLLRFHAHDPLSLNF